VRHIDQQNRLWIGGNGSAGIWGAAASCWNGLMSSWVALNTVTRGHVGNQRFLVSKSYAIDEPFASAARAFFSSSRTPIAATDFDPAASRISFASRSQLLAAVIVRRVSISRDLFHALRSAGFARRARMIAMLS